MQHTLTILRLVFVYVLKIPKVSGTVDEGDFGIFWRQDGENLVCTVVHHLTSIALRLRPHLELFCRLILDDLEKTDALLIQWIVELGNRSPTLHFLQSYPTRLTSHLLHNACQGRRR